MSRKRAQERPLHLKTLLPCLFFQVNARSARVCQVTRNYESRASELTQPKRAQERPLHPKPFCRGIFIHDESSPMSSFPQRLHHELPTWVDPEGAVFHIRIRAAPENLENLTNENLAPKLLASAIEYAKRRIWWPALFLIMPDHIHALLSFSVTRNMSRVIGDWKKWHHVQTWCPLAGKLL